MFDNRRTADNLREVGFLAVCLLLVYLFITLYTYSEADPSFSATAADATIKNVGGKIGAYLSALLFELFGRASYLLCLIILIFGWALLLRPSGGDELTNMAWWVAGLGVLLFMISSSSLEYLRFHNNQGLPAGAGGLVGKLIAPVMVHWFGLLGASLILVIIWLLSWSLAAGLSWFAFLELVGEAVEKAVKFLYRMQTSYTQRAAAEEAPAAAAPPPKKNFAIQQSGRKKEPTLKVESVKRKSPPPAAPASAVKAAAAGEHAPPSLPSLQLLDESPPGDEIDEAQLTAVSQLIENSLPSLQLLDESPPGDEIDEAQLTAVSQLIENSLADFNIKATVAAVHPGPVITRYDIQPATGVKGAQVVNLARDLARALSVSAIRVLENIPGTNYIGLEIPNQKRAVVILSEILSSEDFAGNTAALPLALGKTAAGEAAITDLSAMPHLLVAGATGAGKSVFVNAILLSLLYSRTPAQLRLLLIDPKMLELAIYADIPHLLAPVVTDMELAPAALHWAVEEMETRYRNMAVAGVRHITSYNAAATAGKVKSEEGEPLQPMPYIAVIIDELADLMMVAGKKVEISISRLAQKARAAGIHIVLATQRPSVDVITGLIKANIPCRLSFQVASKIDSRTILDQMGAETLLGKGDMLYMPSGSGIPQRLHGAFVSDDEVRRVVEDVRRQGGAREYLTDFSEVLVADGKNGGDAGANGDGEQDPLYDEAVETVVQSNRASISLVQRKLRIGYNRAARLVEAMEAAGLVSPMNEFGVRKVLKK